MGLCRGGGVGRGKGTQEAPRGPQKGDRSVSARPPPASAETSLSCGVARPARPAPPPGTGAETCTTPPRPRAGSEAGPKGGAAGEAGQRGSWVLLGRRATREFLCPFPLPHPRLWESFPDDSANLGSSPTLLLYSRRNRYKQTIARPRHELANHQGAWREPRRSCRQKPGFSRGLSPEGLE